ncbi:SprT family zinc-dependent metalloprotease [Neptunicella marina]|uniref:SprT family zinc-dependent metalloprotease n=1 Tax=Neptunicella marina TaxID=2125989 RepID=UPI0030CA5459
MKKLNNLFRRRTAAPACSGNIPSTLAKSTTASYPAKTTLEQQIVDQVEHCYQQAERHLNKPFPRPVVGFNQRGKIAGSARLQLNELRFNRTLLKDNPEHFLTDVVPHEVSHLLVHQLYGRVKPHGYEWQQMMRQVYGLHPQTRHQMDVSKVQGKTFNYRCHCQQHKLTIRRHNKALKGMTYMCRSCGSALVADS